MGLCWVWEHQDGEVSGMGIGCGVWEHRDGAVSGMGTLGWVVLGTGTPGLGPCQGQEHHHGAVSGTGTLGWGSVGYGNSGMGQGGVWEQRDRGGVNTGIGCWIWEQQDGQGDGYGNSGMGAVSIQE